MSLRSRLIEAGARDYRKEDREYWLGIMENALDAFLDVLEANTDEWVAKGRNFDNISATDHITDKGLAWRLIAVLRDGGDEEDRP